MATKNLNLGIVPVSRGEFDSTTIYYKDNIVQYKRGSYQVISESPIVGVSPTNDNRWDVTISTETSNVHTYINYVHELQSLYLMFFDEQLSLKFGDLRLILENGNSQSSNYRSF